MRVISNFNSYRKIRKAEDVIRDLYSRKLTASIVPYEETKNTFQHN